MLLLAVSVNSSAAAENSTLDDTACADNCTVLEAQGDDVTGALTHNVTVDSEGVVLQARNYTCGPAALATVLQRLGVNTTEDELAGLAGTTEEGTTMQGLLEASMAKGMNATGMKLNISELTENMIAYTINDGTGHYTVINGITNDTIKLADPSLGDIEMNIEEFAEIYSGYTLVINDHNNPQVNETTDQSNKNTNSSDSINNLTDTASDVQADNRTLTDEEMKNIKGKCWQFLAPVTIGTIIISVRNKYVPKKYWCYIAYHPPFKKVRAYIGKDHRIHYIEYDV
ncbi:MAG: cysteine peptidase family C39 domain-containing protein [Methanothermobacter wolfeii]|nr:cysteine peptidase family C39 domain-containing protein [Methanothermobacter wolfeii]